MGRAGNGHPNRASCSGNGEFSAMYFCDRPMSRHPPVSRAVSGVRPGLFGGEAQE